jgi:hypothetical protein
MQIGSINFNTQMAISTIHARRQTSSQRSTFYGKDFLDIQDQGSYSAKTLSYQIKLYF